MAQTLVLTLAGEDRPGLVDTLSRIVLEHDGNWDESRMARLAGHFAGILLVEVPAPRTDALVAALQDLEGQGMKVDVARGAPAPARPGGWTLRLELVGQDRPGIVHQISHLLARQGVSVEELTTERVSASMSGENLFQASAELSVPAEVRAEDLRRGLETLADELMVDLSFDEGSTA